MTSMRTLIFVIVSLASASAQFTPAAAPSFDHASGTYTNVFWLGMTSSTPGADVRYTTDGTEPGPTSTLAADPILIASTATVKARAFKAGLPDSATSTAAFAVQIRTRTVPALLQVVPRSYQSDPSGFIEACLHTEQWPSVLASTTYLETSLGINNQPDAALRTCFATLAAAGVQMTVSASIINPFTSGIAAFAEAQPVLRRLIALGAPLSAILMNEPLTGAPAEKLAYPDVVRETTTWMALVRQHFPGIRLVLQEAYPANSPAGLIGFARDLNAVTTAMGIHGLDGFELDHDWAGTRWSVDDIQRIHLAIHAARMQFSIIIWPSGPTSANDCTFGSRTYNQYRYTYSPGYVRFGEAFVPDVWSVASWDPIPSRMLPETGAGCTFMQGVRAIVVLGI